MLRRRLLIEWWAILLLTGVLVAAMALTRATDRIDNAAYDALVGLRAPPPSDRIIIVAIDDASIAAIGPWPWPRRIHAQAIERIAAARPAAIAYDVLFTEAGADDALLATALRKAPVVLPVLFEAPGSDGRAIDVTLPVEPVRSAAAAIGHVALPHDEDGTARSALLTMGDGARRWLHVMEQAYRLAYHRPSAAFARGLGTVAIPYQPRGGGYRTIPFHDVAAGSVPPVFFRDKIVLVGAIAGGLGDRHSVPTRGGGAISGIEVQANLLGALIADRLVRDTSASVGVVAAVLPSAFLMLAFWSFRPSRALGAAGVALAIAALLPAALLVFGGMWIPPAAGLIGLLIVYPLWGWRRLQTVDGAIAQELALFAGEDAPVARGSNSADAHAAQLGASIARLRDLRRLIADTVDGVADPLVVTSIDGHVLIANAAALELLGDLVGQKLPEGLAAPGEIAIDGRSFSSRRTPLSDAGGEQRGWILLLAEITAIRAAEQDREQALEFLSHDMRAPQASILALIDGDSPPNATDRIAAYARRTLALADDFVQLARLRAARFAPEETDLCDSLAEATDAVWPQASRAGVRIVAQGLDTPACVIGERDALTRAFVNLLDNAVKFSPPGGEVRCGVAASGEWVDAWIEDDGAGIAADRLDGLFERFGAIERRGSQSSGLGLAFVAAAVARHGGTVGHQALAPHGTRFDLRFPASTESDAGELG
ncbi:CHASE2 domain-containing protein [soil metagenome]